VFRSSLLLTLALAVFSRDAFEWNIPQPFPRPTKASNVQGFRLTGAEKRDLLAFLESLTDKEFLEDPRLNNPWNH